MALVFARVYSGNHGYSVTTIQFIYKYILCSFFYKVCVFNLVFLLLVDPIDKRISPGMTSKKIHEVK
jgi:hypothetical protein